MTESMTPINNALDVVARVARRLGKRGAFFLFCLSILFYPFFDFRDYSHTLHNIPLSVSSFSADDFSPDDDLSYIPPKKLLGNHLYQDNGLLRVNPDGPHPIYELMRDSEAVWNEKLERASKTLEEAVVEYRRRYNRDPPLGFDDWYVSEQSPHHQLPQRLVQVGLRPKKHHVQLPDEYDSIHDSLEYLWGIDPRDLQADELEYEKARSDSFALGKLTQEDPISMLTTTFPKDKVAHLYQRWVNRHLHLISEVEQFIPPFRAVFTPNDNPHQVKDYHRQTLALEAAKEKRRESNLSLLPPSPSSVQTSSIHS